VNGYIYLIISSFAHDSVAAMI